MPRGFMDDLEGKVVGEEVHFKVKTVNFIRRVRFHGSDHVSETPDFKLNPRWRSFDRQHFFLAVGKATVGGDEYINRHNAADLVYALNIVADKFARVVGFG